MGWRRIWTRECQLLDGLLHVLQPQMQYHEALQAMLHGTVRVKP